MREYKINMDRPDPTPEEIARNKDFSKVLSRYSTLTKPVYLKTWFLSTAALVVAATALIIANVLIDKPRPGRHAEQSYVYEPSQPDLMADVPFINPPMDGINVDYEHFQVNAEERSRLEYGSSGTQIKIPKGAFMDEDGRDVEGAVELKYREFHDVVDIFTSGIPMDYDSAGVKYHFESAGMMEILAYKDGKPVFLKPDKEIEIEMASNFEGEHYNLYHLDEAGKKWDFKGKDRVTPVEGFSERPVPAGPGGNVEEAERFSEDVAGSDGLLGIVEKAVAPEQEPEVKELKRNVNIAKNNIKKLKKTEPIEPRRISKERYNFDIEVDPKEFPEIAIYKNTRFEIGDENKDFNERMYDIAWEDVLLKEKVAGVNYDLTLSKGDARYTWVVYPVFEGEDLETAMDVFRKKNEAYKEKLKARKEEEKIARELYEARKAAYKAQQAAHLERLKERARQYAEAERLLEKRFMTMQKAIRAFAITQFGSWNCDSPVPRPRGTTVSASFTDEDGNELVFGNVYLLQPRRNSMFPCNHYVAFNPNRENVLLGVTSDNRLAVFSADRFKDIKDGKYTFKMKVLEKQLSTVEEIKNALAI